MSPDVVYLVYILAQDRPPLTGNQFWENEPGTHQAVQLSCRFPPAVYVSRSLDYTTPIESIRPRLSGHGDANGGQPETTVRRATSNITQIELSIIKATLALAPNSSILSKPHHRLWCLPASRYPNNAHAIYAVPPPAVLTVELPPSK
jgi:hypothetical protein